MAIGDNFVAGGFVEGTVTIWGFNSWLILIPPEKVRVCARQQLVLASPAKDNDSPETNVANSFDIDNLEERDS